MFSYYTPIKKTYPLPFVDSIYKFHIKTTAPKRAGTPYKADPAIIYKHQA